MRPESGGQFLGKRRSLLFRKLVGQQTVNGAFHLPDRLFADIRQDQGIIINLFNRLLFHHLQDRSCGLLTKLRVYRPQHRMRTHHDLVGGKRDKRAARHRIMWHENGNLALVRLQGTGNLNRRQNQPAGRMQNHVDRGIGIRHLDCLQHLFAVMHINVTHQREAEKAHGFLAMHHQDYPRAALFLDLGDLAGALKFEHAALHHGLQGRKDEKQPDQIHASHHLFPF